MSTGPRCHPMLPRPWWCMLVVLLEPGQVPYLLGPLLPSFLPQRERSPAHQKQCRSSFHLDAIGLRVPKQCLLRISFNHYGQSSCCSCVCGSSRLVLDVFVAVV